MFKPGDKVVVIAGPQKGEKVRTIKDRNWSRPFPLGIGDHSYTKDGKHMHSGPIALRHATADEIAAAEKPLRRGDLVVWNGEIGVVFSNCADRDGDYAIASLTGDPDHYWVKIDELTRISSIGKKVERLKNEMEGAV